MPDNDLDKKKAKLRSVGKYLGLSSQMLIILLAGVFGGIELDKVIEIGFPIFTVVFSIVALVLAIYVAIKDFL